MILANDQQLKSSYLPISERSTVVMTDNKGKIYHIRVFDMQEKNHTRYIMYKKLGIVRDLTKKLYKTTQKRL